MGHGLRTGIQCVGADTSVLIKRANNPQVSSELISKIRCVFNEVPVENHPDKHTYEWTDPQLQNCDSADPRLRNYVDMIVNLAPNPESVAIPLFRYEHTLKGELEKGYKITVESKRQGKTSRHTTLTATAWHPILMKDNETMKVTVASVLDEDDPLVIFQGTEVGLGKVTTIEIIDTSKEDNFRVFGLALGKVGGDLKRIQEQLNSGHAYSDDFGLSAQENFVPMGCADGAKLEDTIWIASGTLALQYQFRSVIRYGVDLGRIDEVEALEAKKRNHEHPDDKASDIVTT